MKSILVCMLSFYLISIVNAQELCVQKPSSNIWAAKEHRCATYCWMKTYGKIPFGELKILGHWEIYMETCKKTVKSNDICDYANALKQCIDEEKEKDHQADRLAVDQTVIKCALETRTNVNIYTIKDAHKYINHDIYACFIRCILIKTNWMDDKNEIIATNEHPEDWNRCRNENQQTDVCIQAVRRYRCFQNI